MFRGYVDAHFDLGVLSEKLARTFGLFMASKQAANSFPGLR